MLKALNQSKPIITNSLAYIFLLFRYMIHAIATTKADFEKLVDRYGDYYAKPCESVVELKALLEKVTISGPDSNAFHEIEAELLEAGMLNNFENSQIQFENEPLWKEFERVFNLYNRK